MFIEKQVVKKLIILAATLGYIELEAQPYNPIFLKDSTVWKYYYFVPFGWSEGTFSVKNLGTTIVNGKLYRTLPNPPYSPYLVIEDSANRKIYSYDTYSNIEFLLYDFSLVKGSNFNMYGYDFNCGRKFYNVSVDTSYNVTTSLGVRKQIELANKKIIWREGVGIIHSSDELVAGPFFIYNASCPFLLDIGFTKLICVKQDNMLAYEKQYTTLDSTRYLCDTTIYDTCNFQAVISTQRYAECTGDSIEYYCNSLVKGPKISYQWYYNGSPIGVNRDKIKLKTSGDDSVKCVVNTSYNCPIKQKSSYPYVLYNYPINVEVTRKDSFLIASANFVSYFWYDCDSNKYLLNEQDKKFIPKKAGRYSVIIQQSSCLDTSECINVQFCNPKLSLLGPDSVCRNTSTIYTSKIDSISNSYRVDWIRNNVFVSNQNQISFIPKEGDSIYFKLNVDSICWPQTVYKSAVKKVKIKSIDRNLHNTSSHIYTREKGSYQWLYCDSNLKPILGEIRDSFKPKNTGFYALAISKNSCTDTTGCYIFSTSSIETFLNLRTKYFIYPNPASQRLNIQILQNVSVSPTVIVNDLLGRALEVKVVYRDNDKIVLDLSTYAPGSYFIFIDGQRHHLQVER